MMKKLNRLVNTVVLVLDVCSLPFAVQGARMGSTAWYHWGVIITIPFIIYWFLESLNDKATDSAKATSSQDFS